MLKLLDFACEFYMCVIEEKCLTVAGHDSFLGDSDPFAQPELFTLIASAEGSNVVLL